MYFTDSTSIIRNGGIDLKKILKVIIICIIALCMSVILLLGTISYSSKIKDPLIGLNAIIKIVKSNSTVELMSTNPLRYISKNEDAFIQYMEDKGYDVDRVGRGFFFTKGNESIALEMEGFMGNYKIFTGE